MRRSDREVTDFNEIINIMKKCDVCRIALFDKQYPYIIPLNFGMDITENNIVLYFHGANEGKKYELIRKNNNVCFEMDCSHQLVLDENKKMCTMKYESVIGTGAIQIADESEKLYALNLIMKQYHGDNFDFSKKAVPYTTILKLSVNFISAKRR